MEKSIKEITSFFIIHFSMFSIESILMHIKILSKIRSIGNYDDYYIQALNLLERCIDFLLEEIHE